MARPDNRGSTVHELQCLRVICEYTCRQYCGDITGTAGYEYDQLRLTPFPRMHLVINTMLLIPETTCMYPWGYEYN